VDRKSVCMIVIVDGAHQESRILAKSAGGQGFENSSLKKSTSALSLLLCMSCSVNDRMVLSYLRHHTLQLKTPLNLLNDTSQFKKN